MVNSTPKPMFSATAPEGRLPQPHKVHLRSRSSLVSWKGVGTFSLQVSLPPEKGRGHFQAGCRDHRLLRSPSGGPSVGSVETAKTALQSGKAGLLWGGTAEQAMTSFPTGSWWHSAHRHGLLAVNDDARCSLVVYLVVSVLEVRFYISMHRPSFSK